MLWADHYIAPDPLAAAAPAGIADVSAYRGGVALLLTMRPLIEAGVVVPAFTELAVAMAGRNLDDAVARDLADANFVSWAKQQIVVEGPSAREAAFIHVRDDYYTDADWFYLHGRIMPGSPRESGSGTVEFRNRLLNHFDPSYDYRPWLETVRSQAVAEVTKRLNLDLAAADLLGADLITSSPFRARALRRRVAALPTKGELDIRGAVWARVPWLPDASPELLLKIARQEDRVADLRRATATALRSVATGDDLHGAEAIGDVAADLAYSAQALGKELRAKRSLDVGLSGGLATGSVLVAGTLAPPIVIGGLLAGAAAARFPG